MRKLKLFAGSFTVFLLIQVIGCSLLTEDRFAIVLAESGETLLNEHDVAAYHADGTLDLNENGIRKWNCHLTYPDIPKLDDTLYQQEFVIKIDGGEICRGKFWSLVSSSSVSGFVILDSLFKLNSEKNSIQIQSNYPGRGLTDASVVSQLSQFFQALGILK